MKKLLFVLLMVFYGTTSFALSLPWTNDIQNSFRDQSAERLVNASGTADNTLLEVGDVLRGVFEIDKIESPNEFNITANGLELTGLFEAKVVSREFLFSRTVTSLIPTNLNYQGVSQLDNLTSDFYKYTFAPSVSFEATYGAGAMMATFLSDTQDYQVTGAGLDFATADGTATNGTPYWTFGLGDTGEWIFDAAPEDVSWFSYLSTTDTVGSSNVGLNLLSRGIGPELFQDVFFLNDAGSFVNVDLRANISLFGVGDLETPFDVKNKVDGVLHPVPEPSTMILFGVGLVGLAVVRKRSKK